MKPSPRSRVIFSIAIGMVGAAIHYLQLRATPDHPGDFGQAWFGARALLHGANPWVLMGRGYVYDWPWRSVYPATAFVAAIPLALLPQFQATLIFVFASSALLAYSVTLDGWERTPMFGSIGFVIAAAAAQWSPLLTAAIGLPVLGVFLAAKPTIGLALGISGSPKMQRFALLGALVLTVFSFLLFPQWPAAWLESISSEIHPVPPFMRFGGFVLALALLRWRRVEARMIFALGLVPQTGSWYEVVPLFLVPATMRESMILVITTSLGWLSEDRFFTARTEVEINAQVTSVMIAFAYIPAIVMVLRRPNEGAVPPWLRWMERRSRT